MFRSFRVTNAATKLFKGTNFARYTSSNAFHSPSKHEVQNAYTQSSAVIIRL